MYRYLGVIFCVWSFLAFAGHHEDGMHVMNGWVKEPLPGVDATAVYLSMHNPGKVPDRLISVSTDLAQISEIHEMLMVDNVMKMRRLDSGIAIAPDELVRLEPGGSHIMLFDLNKTLEVRETYTVLLNFERAGTMRVPVTVKAVGDAEHHQHH